MHQHEPAGRSEHPVANENDTLAPSCPFQAPASRPSHVSHSNLESANHPLPPVLPLAGQGDVSSVQVPPRSNSPTPISNQNPSPVAHGLSNDEHEMFEATNPSSSRFRSIRYFAHRILKGLFRSSHETNYVPTPPQSSEHGGEARDRVTANVPNEMAPPGLITVHPNPLRATHGVCACHEAGPRVSPTTDEPPLNLVREERKPWRWLPWLPISQSSRIQSFQEHKIIAIATALRDWDGFIPGRRTRGSPLKKGEEVQICNIVDSNWLHAHQGADCVYVPRVFVRIERLQEDLGSRLARNLFREPKVSKRTHVAKLLAPLQCGFRGVEPPEHMAEKKERLNIPPAPFPREPSDMNHMGNRVIVDTECTYHKCSEGIVITSTFTLVPALHSRFTDLWFSLKLPGGQKIAWIYPEHTIGQRTDVQHHLTRSKELSLKASVRDGGVGIELEYGESRTQVVEYSRSIKAEIHGGGRNSDNATWIASEDAAGRYGLDNKIKFSIALQTQAPPANIACQYSIGVRRQSAMEASSQPQESFDHAWDVGFLSDLPVEA